VGFRVEFGPRMLEVSLKLNDCFFFFFRFVNGWSSTGRLAVTTLSSVRLRSETCALELIFTNKCKICAHKQIYRKFTANVWRIMFFFLFEIIVSKVYARGLHFPLFREI